MLVHWDRLVERKTNELRKQKSVVWRAVERRKRMKINRTREFFLLCHTTTIQSRESRKFHLLLYSEGCKVARRMTPWLMRVVLIDICWFLWPMEKRKAGEWEIALGKSFQEFIGGRQSRFELYQRSFTHLAVILRTFTLQLPPFSSFGGNNMRNKKQLNFCRGWVV